MHESVHPAEVDERAEVDDRRHRSLADLAGLEVRQELVTLLALGLFEIRAAAEHDVVAVLVELDDLALELLAHERVQVAHAPQVDERRGEEAAQADIDDQAALYDLDDRSGHHFVGFLLRLDRAPRALVLRALLRQDQPAVLVFLREDEGFDVLADRHDLVRIDVVADRELFGRNDAFGLVADVEEHLVGVDLHDRPGDQASVVELDDGGVDRVGERTLQVVDDDDGVFGFLFERVIAPAVNRVDG